MGDQSRLRSAVEVATNTAAGLVGSWLIAMAVITSVEDRTAAATLTTALCTVWSLARGWAIRRAFNRMDRAPTTLEPAP